ncbi:MAG: hypothetical protein M2R45_00606 [Verrucomicrobia subdivision 3 bacterium]|nr:hypothetical protein [Limisphaerales bacterium]MCS1414510.1 hypothetical protein [Limisphaerales bacterium]
MKQLPPSSDRRAYLFALILSIVLISNEERGVAAPGDELAFFNDEILPLLKENCLKCHGGEKIKGGLQLTSRNSILHGGDSGPAVELRDPESSLLLDMISYRDSDHEMPPKGKLDAADIQRVTKWVAMGVPYDPAHEVQSKAYEEESSGYLTEVNEETRNYWAFRTIEQPVVPEAAFDGWDENPLDAFVAKRLADVGLKPNEPATRQQLIRRAYYGLIGLPPTLEEVEAFERDESSDAFERVVDHLLSLPQYGEKWGRHWLDLVRYAETNGYERDGPKPEAWRYRDYVIKSLNDDKPYDVFVREQLAGDELDEVTTETIIATGYQRMGVWDDEPADPDQAYYDGLDDVVSTTSQVFLGLTVGCARCHDHKIDPIPQRDYYRMMGFFHNTLNDIKQGPFKKSPYTLNTLREIASEAQREEHDRLRKEHEASLESLEDQVDAFETKIIATFSNPEKEDAADRRNRELLLRQKREKALNETELENYLEAKKNLQQLKHKKLPRIDSALSIQENGRTTPDTYVLVRGNAHGKGEMVRPGYPSVLGFRDPVIPPAPDGVASSGQRSVLADWITSPENPLTARVMANRVWYFHFGRGIVRSPSNFGQNGERPTHPELLDWLASTLIKKGWSLKKFHKTLMLSKTYQMSSAPNTASLEKDPTNDFFWRFDMRRLTAEEVRDSIINLTGKLNLKMGGPSVYTDIPDEVRATASRPDNAWGESALEERWRRSVYVYVKRSLHEPMLKAFDSADTDSTCAVRFATTVPTQALTMLNSKFVNDSAAAFAQRLVDEAGDRREDQVRLGLSLATNRRASAAEVEAGMKMIEEIEHTSDLTKSQALERFCLLAINLNECIYLD